MHFRDICVNSNCSGLKIAETNTFSYGGLDYKIDFTVECKESALSWIYIDGPNIVMPKQVETMMVERAIELVRENCTMKFDRLVLRQKFDFVEIKQVD